MNTIFCNSLIHRLRFATREVMVGNVGIGGNNPIRVQSMTTTETMNTKATVEQSIRMIEAGCELIRITAPSINEAKNLDKIKKELRARGYQTPLIADIHFTPNAAELAARIVEKVRVNPGNYADKKKFEQLEYTDKTYEAELERIRERFIPLVKICKEYGTAMRIGTNHGSLSDRILSRYGDTPLGMVESALEFVRICEEQNYYNLVLSMKASNPQVMVQAYRLLVQKMIESNRNYPLHLGVTEAGEGEDGRIKSAIGIGTLLEDGLGDTIRVSLTEEPEFEIPVAKNLVNRYSTNGDTKSNKNVEYKEFLKHYNPFEYNRKTSFESLNIGSTQVPRVIADYSSKQKITPPSLFAVGYNYSKELDKWNLSDQACDYIYVGDNSVDFEIPGTLGIICSYTSWLRSNKNRQYPLYKDTKTWLNAQEKSKQVNFVIINDLADLDIVFDSSVVLVFNSTFTNAISSQRLLFLALIDKKIQNPVIVKRNYNSINEDQLQLYSSTDFGSLLIDGFGDGVWIEQNSISDSSKINSTLFGILQATRTRISKTEYISCPSCGRTLFDLQETTAKIRSRTDHLKGVKIGIMGCIVNGPGEMADADYGYVGTGPGKITLYKGKTVVKKNINSEQAVDELILLIKEGGDWVEKTN